LSPLVRAGLYSELTEEDCMKPDTLGAYNIADLRELAKRRTPKGIFEFVDRGTEDEIGVRNNRAIFERIKLKPRTLVDVSQRSQEITLFGKKQPMPIVIGPTGSAGLMWYHGEAALARAAAAAGIPFSLATGSTTAMETVAEESPGATRWFQLYMWPDRSLSHQLVERARNAGFEALIVTVDGAAAGNREYNMRNGFTMPFRFTRRNCTDVLMHPRWMMGTLLRYIATTGMPKYENYPTHVKNRITNLPMGRASPRSDSTTWDDLRALRKLWPHTMIVKGILHPQDAVMAAECGAEGVVVSNHGGRNLDSAISSIEALPEILDAVGKRMTVMVDSGFRRGSDVVKALALGAHAVLIGRATLYGTGAGGEVGAARAIALFREEINRVMALLGVRSIAELGREHLVLPRDFPAHDASPGAVVLDHPRRSTAIV
jgi:isopentenyl diphosphate isomerase/L-lactate dehydrogenase-like FMN-dependent dehydrogenase